MWVVFEQIKDKNLKGRIREKKICIKWGRALVRTCVYIRTHIRVTVVNDYFDIKAEDTPIRNNKTKTKTKNIAWVFIFKVACFVFFF